MKNVNWFNLEISAVVCLWAGMCMYFIVIYGNDNPKSLLWFPSMFFMVFTVPAAVYNVWLGFAMLIAGSAVVMKWSMANVK